jgi:exosortase H (IPTLxxWG-CTERM-specific)
MDSFDTLNTMQNRQKETKKIKAKAPQKSSGVLRFVITYLLLMSAFFLVTVLQPVKNIFDLNGLYTQGVVIISANLANILCISAQYHGSVIMLPSVSLDVQFGCNGLEAVMIYSVAVLAYPAGWKKKLLGIIAGFVILQTVNIIRIVFLIYSSMHFKKLFEFIHIYIAQGIMIALSLGVFFLYLTYTKNDKNAL